MQNVGKDRNALFRKLKSLLPFAPSSNEVSKINDGNLSKVKKIEKSHLPIFTFLKLKKEKKVLTGKYLSFNSLSLEFNFSFVLLSNKKKLDYCLWLHYFASFQENFFLSCLEAML